MARDKKKKKAHGTPKAKSQKKQVKKVRDKKRSMEDPSLSRTRPVVEPHIDPNISAVDSPEGAKTVIDYFGSVYNMMHACKG